MKGQRLVGNDPTVFQTCVLGLPGQVNKFRFESSASHGLGLLDPFATQSNKSNIIMINLDVCLKVLPWLNRISCLHRMVNQLEYGKLKCEVRTYSLLLFSKRKTRASQNT